jgi:hypothetical protein
MATITHKRGDTFNLECNAEDQYGDAVSIADFTITSQIRSADDALLQALTVTKTEEAAGLFTLSATATQTEAWAPGNYDCDIEFTNTDGAVVSTETMTIVILKDITRD